MTRVGVIAAMECEARTLVGACARSGEILATSEEQLVGVSGAGARPATEMASRLIERGADRLLSWGLAGALVGDLEPGSVIVPMCVIGSRSDRYPANELWWRRTLASFPARSGPRRGCLAETLKAVVRETDKTALCKATDAVAVDMESAAVARVALAARVPFLCIRVIADALEQRVPTWVVDQPERITALTMAGRALCQPGDWWLMLRLALSGRRALAQLRRLAPLARGGALGPGSELHRSGRGT